MKKLISSLILSFLITPSLLAEGNISIGKLPSNGLVTSGTAQGWGLVEILSYVESFLLKVVLPIIIIGTTLYIAYELFLAQGDEEKMKKAWKSITYASVWVISIGLAYAIISFASRLAI